MHWTDSRLDLLAVIVGDRSLVLLVIKISSPCFCRPSTASGQCATRACRETAAAEFVVEPYSRSARWSSEARCKRFKRSRCAAAGRREHRKAGQPAVINPVGAIRGSELSSRTDVGICPHPSLRFRIGLKRSAIGPRAVISAGSAERSGYCAHRTLTAASTVRAAPFTCTASSDRRNTTTFATSAGLP